MATSIPQGLQNILGELHYEIGVITLVSSYVVGSVFFRQDPKRPDATSALYVWMKSTNKERRGLAVQSKLAGAEALPGQEESGKYTGWPCVRAFFRPGKYLKMYKLDPQFPYPHLKCYLGARGLTHLTRYVPWCPIKEDFGFRTKMFINLLKIRLHSLAPSLCWHIVRNEAHVRLATSVWYASNCLLCLGVFCLVILVPIGVLLWYKDLTPTLYAPVATSTLVVFLCLIMKYQLRKCIHYMRVREVIYVLETSHLTSQLDNRFNVDEVICKDRSNECLQCERIAK
jgi:hypothetical protein